MQKTILATNFADIMGVSKATLQRWEANGSFVPSIDDAGQKFFYVENLLNVPEIKNMVCSMWDEEMQVKPLRPFKSIELFVGAGGLALGMEKAGFSHVLLNEIDHDVLYDITIQSSRVENCGTRCKKYFFQTVRRTDRFSLRGGHVKHFLMRASRVGLMIRGELCSLNWLVP